MVKDIDAFMNGLRHKLMRLALVGCGCDLMLDVGCWMLDVGCWMNDMHSARPA